MYVELHREGSAPAACAAGLFDDNNVYIFVFQLFIPELGWCPCALVSFCSGVSMSWCPCVPLSNYEKVELHTYTKTTIFILLNHHF